MRRTRLLVSALACAGCVVAPITMLAGIQSPVRAAATLALFCLAPGAAVLPFAQPRHAALELGLVVGVSLAVVTIAAQVMLWLGAWAPTTAAYLLAGLCLPVLTLHLVLPVVVHRARDG